MVLLTLSLTVLRDGRSQARSCGPVAATPPSQTTGPITVTKSDASCEVPSGGYIRVGVSYKLLAQSELDGACQTRTWYQGQCVNVTLYERYHGAVRTYVNGIQDGSLPVSLKKKNMNTTTTPLNTTNGEPWATWTAGSFTYTAEGTASDPGNCGFPMSWPATNSVTMHAVACKPEWNLAGNPPVNVHFPPTTISLHVPSNMWG